jgi:tetratricopeptide (TPR) repeat protein
MKEKISFLKWTGIAFTILISFLFPPLTSHLALAGLVSFQKEYAYQASEYDSKVSCRALALEQVKRLLLEELGTYLESETEVKNFQLTKDQIVILTAGIVRAEVIDEWWDGKTYHLKAKITADPKDVANSIDKLRQDRQKTKELEETRKKADEALREVEKLKKELKIAKAGKAEQDQYNRAVIGLSANDWFEKGYALGNAGRHQEAMEAYTRAIELNPKSALAYGNRGNAYGRLGDHQRAIRDVDRAIELNPKNALAFANRGRTYTRLRDYQQAIRDFDRAIELNPKYAAGYHSRGLAYYYSGKYQKALNDSNKVLEINSEDIIEYSSRGLIYARLGDYQKATNDLNKAISMDPDNMGVNYNMGCFYSIQNKPDQACFYLRKVIEKGYKGWDSIKKDIDLDNIRNHECYRQIMKGK